MTERKSDAILTCVTTSGQEDHSRDALDGNPDVSPSQGWETDSEHVDFEARALVRRLTATERAVLARLSDDAGQRFHVTQLASGLGQTVTVVEAAISRINTLADALGRRPMVEVAEDQATVPAPYAAVIHRVLDKTA